VVTALAFIFLFDERLNESLIEWGNSDQTQQLVDSKAGRDLPDTFLQLLKGG